MSQTTVKTVGGVTTKITTTTRTMTSSTQQQQQQLLVQQQQQAKEKLITKPQHKTEIRKENQISVKSNFDTLEKKQNEHHDLPAPKTKPQQSRTEDTCVRCNRTVYKMEEVIAEQQVWHKNCFRCKACDKPLNRHSKVDSFHIHEGVVYCKIHFKQLFAVDDGEPKRKPEMIIRENQPVELPDGVVRSTKQHDLGLEDIQTAAVKTRFQMFEKISTTKEAPEELQRNVGIKRSATVLSTMKKMHAKGIDVGVKEFKKDLDYDDDSVHSEDYDDETDVDLIRAKRAQRELPFSIDNMNEIKNKFEGGIDQGREVRHQERKQEIQNIRSRIFLGKQARTKEMYENALLELDNTSKLRNKGLFLAYDLDNVKAAAEKAQNIKKSFETGDVYRKSFDDKEFDDFDQVKQQEEKVSKGQISNKVSERMQMLAKQQAQDNIIKSHTKVKNVEIADISNQYEFFENYDPEEHKNPHKSKECRITPPRENISANDEDNEKKQNGIKIDGIKIDGLKIDGVVEKATNSYIDRVKKSKTMKRQQGFENVVDMRNEKQNQTASNCMVNGKKVDTTQNQPIPAGMKSSKPSSDEENRRFYDKAESEESEISSRRPGYLDCDLEHARQAARTRDLKELFEKWNYENNVYDTAEYNDSIPEYDEIDDSQTETTKTIRAKFENLPNSGRIQNTKQSKTNRFVD